MPVTPADRVLESPDISGDQLRVKTPARLTRPKVGPLAKTPCVGAQR